MLLMGCHSGLVLSTSTTVSLSNLHLLERSVFLPSWDLSNAPCLLGSQSSDALGGCDLGMMPLGAVTWG